MFLHGASSASAVLFVVFNFMMTLAELRESALIVGVLDTVAAVRRALLDFHAFSAQLPPACDAATCLYLAKKLYAVYPLGIPTL